MLSDINMFINFNKNVYRYMYIYMYMYMYMFILTQAYTCMYLDHAKKLP